MPWLTLILLIPYLYLFLKIWSGLARIKPFIGKDNPTLFVSVVVACRNEGKNLPSLLMDLSEQEYDPGLFEIIVVDDDSTDNTLECASSFRGIKNIKVIRNAGTGKKEALGTGIASASSGLILTTDADCRLPRQWLSVIASFFTEKKADMAICPVYAESKPGLCTWFSRLEFLSLQGVTAGTAINGNPVMCNGANLAFTKESFMENAGKLHPELVSGDDIFLLHGLKENPDKRILWLESEFAAVTTTIPSAISSFLKQRARWISKAGSYKDSYTIVLEIVTFVTILLQLSLIAGGFFNPVLWLVYLASLAVKSIPDYLILRNTAVRYQKRNLLKWFLPAQVIYPFYISAVSVCSLLYRGRW